MKRGFYIGRFQPYHEGQQYVLTQIAKEIDEIVKIGRASCRERV